MGASVASGLAIHLLGAEIGIPVATIVMTMLVLVLCEIMPKAVAARHPRGVSRAVGLPPYWVAFEGPPLVLLALVLWWLAGKARTELEADV